MVFFCVVVYSLVVYSMVVYVILGKVLGWFYLLGKWVRLFSPSSSKASGSGLFPFQFDFQPTFWG
jgi:hypothetical protein